MLSCIFHILCKSPAARSVPVILQNSHKITILPLHPTSDPLRADFPSDPSIYTPVPTLWITAPQTHTMTAAKLLTIFAGFVGVVALAVYVFGIPPEVKRKLERQALKTMGENKMSYMAKGKCSRARLHAFASLPPTGADQASQAKSPRSPTPTREMSTR